MPPRTIAFALSEHQTIPVSWKTFAGSRSIRLSIRAGAVQVSSPPRAPLSAIMTFLETQRTWISSHLERHQETAKPNTLLYLGGTHTLAFRTALTGTGRVTVQSPYLMIDPITPTENSVRNSLERWLQSEAARVGVPLLQELAKKMEVEVPQLKFKETKSRWGSCTSHGAITLNWRLIHAPIAVYRYVVVHELAHRVHLNHSAAFWNLVEQHDPDFRVHRGWLKRHGAQCTTPPIQLPQKKSQ